MKLQPVLIPSWPKLAWVAVARTGADHVDLLHGPRVEACDQWAAEAVWAGEFSRGAFDEAELVFGSGVRCRDNRVVFVPAAAVMDRLWYRRKAQTWYVSNSLPALCACADLTLSLEHNYANDRHSAIRTTWGADSCVRSFPLQDGEANTAWFNNLVLERDQLREEPKPILSPPFACYGDYRSYLTAAAESLRVNLESSDRRHAVTPLASVSSGYDSPAAAVISREAGCTKAVTIHQASSLWRGSDSGEPIAQVLGLACRRYPRTSRVFPHEIALWAGSGYSNLMNWCLFDYPEPVCLFFTGNYGDAIWARERFREPFTFDVWDDLGASEFRLAAGMLQCPVPYWGMRRAKEIEAITLSEEMAPWTLHTEYDRPIPRRIVEEAGVERGSFAVRKKNTSHEGVFHWPYSPEAKASFRRYLRERGVFAPGPVLDRFVRAHSAVHSFAYLNTLARLGLKAGRRPWLRMRCTRLLFQWANHELQKQYEAGLAESSGSDEPAISVAPTRAETGASGATAG